MATGNNTKERTMEITIVRLPGSFIKAKGIGRMHALNDGTWYGHLNGVDTTAATENEAVQKFQAAVTAAAIKAAF